MTNEVNSTTNPKDMTLDQLGALAWDHIAKAEKLEAKAEQHIKSGGIYREAAQLREGQPMQTALIIPQGTLDAQRMNKKHWSIEGKQHSAKIEAASLGEDLIAKKADLKHGEFKPWIKSNLEFSYDSAKNYMNVAKAKRDRAPLFDACTSIREVLDLGKKPKAPKASLEPTEDDLRIMGKLKAVAERGVTEGEREAAQRKLDSYSSAFGDDKDEVIEKATEAAQAKEDEVPWDTQIQQIKTAMVREGPDFLAEWLLKAMVKDHDLFKDVMERVVFGTVGPMNTKPGSVVFHFLPSSLFRVLPANSFRRLSSLL